jgi:predicted Holliday junction resolvase-like endonuclease
MAKKKISDQLFSYQSECPHCRESFPISDSEIFTDKNFGEKSLQYYEQQLRELEAYKEQVNAAASDYGWLAKNTEAINLGFLLEKIVLTFPDFKYNHSECRPLFDPIDYIAFEGLSSGEITNITFIDIKSGNARLTDGQKQIKQTVIDKNVKFRLYEY